MVKKTITIGHLYPKQMNVYGDMGNVITLRYRLEQRGMTVRYLPIESLRVLSKEHIDILIGGGGQDSNQELVQSDLQRHGSELRSRCEDGITAFMVCGMYQLLGKRFVLADGTEVSGAGILDLETHAGHDRLIGNIVVDSPYGKLVGFENHSGRTYLGHGVKPLGTVLTGAGNNGDDHTEGTVFKNVFGTYMHGPGLAKNPALADELLIRALARKYGATELIPLNDTIEYAASTIAAKRPR